MESLGDAACAADVNTIIPVSEAATGLRRPLGPEGFMELSQAAGVNHGISLRFHIAVPGGRWQVSLPLPVTPERAIWAGSIPDVPRVCANGLPARRMGVNHSCRLGATAVNSGLQSGRGHSLSGAAAASRSCFPCSAVWELAAAWVRADRISSSPAARARGFSGMPRPPAGNRVNAVRWLPAAFSGGFSTSACIWAPVVTDGPGVSPCGSGA